MKHVHADLILQYAHDAQETDKPWERWECCSEVEGIYARAHGQLKWYPSIFYRRIDPYRHLKEAQARGETIQKNMPWGWDDIPDLSNSQEGHHFADPPPNATASSLK